jgi:ornithine cyclodeaminase/alanine dehydrogenase
MSWLNIQVEPYASSWKLSIPVVFILDSCIRRCELCGIMSLPDVLYLSCKDVEKADLKMSEIVDTVEAAFRDKGEGRVEMPPKPGIHPQEDAFIHAMPAYIPKMKAAGVKWVSGFPNNYRNGLPYITGLIILNNPETGVPLCVMDCTWITAKRTGAATAVAAKYLARKDSRVLGILGCGVQGRSNLEALTIVLNELEEVKAYDINEENKQKYAKEMTHKYSLSVTPVGSPKDAVKDSDVVVTAGPILKHSNPVIEASWFKDGGLACPLDFDSYWKPKTMHSMDKFYTDDLDQLMFYKTAGYFSDIPEVYADLGEIVANKKLGRESDKERIMIMNLGLAINDMATAIMVYEKANSKRLGTLLPL